MNEHFGEGHMLTLYSLASFSCLETKLMTAPIPGLKTTVTLDILVSTKLEDSHLFNYAMDISLFKLQRVILSFL
jgi:hypothetical protein